MRLHLALNTARFDEAVVFYRTFFGVDPVKHKPGYAKFSVTEPPVNLTLNQSAATPAGRLNHLGVEVSDAAAVQAATARLAAAGLKTRVEEKVDCCYALQDKVWVQDPDGNAWEVFVVHVGDTKPELTARDAAPAPCCVR